MATAESTFQLEIEQTGETAVVKCSGKLVAGVTDQLFGPVSKLIPVSKKIVLDLSELAYMDSMGLGTIIRLKVTTRSAGCELELINLGKRVKELLGLTNVLGVFTTCGEHTIRIP